MSFYFGLVFAVEPQVDTGRLIPAGDSIALPAIEVVTRRLGPRGENSDLAEIDVRPSAELPLSLRSIDSTALQRFGIRSLSDIVKIESSVGDAYNTVGYVESLQIRGFRLDDVLNYRRNGLPVSNHAILAVENIDRLEILKGVSGILSGSSTPGGLVNLVTRRPPDSDLHSITIGLSERGTRSFQGELGGRFGVAHVFGYRVNLLEEKREPFARDAKGRRTLAALALDWQGEGERLDFEVESHDLSQISVPAFGLLDRNGNGIAESIPSASQAAFGPRANLNTQAWSEPFVSRSQVASLRWHQRISDRWLWGARIGYQRIDTDDRIAFPDGCTTAGQFGNSASVVYPGLCGDGRVDIYDFRSLDERRRLWAADSFVEGRIDTGLLEHSFRVGLRTTRYKERLPPAYANNFAGTISVYAPTPVPARPELTFSNTNRSLRADEFYVFDAVRTPKWWSFWWGLRATQLSRNSELSDGTEQTPLNQNFVTPWASLGLRPWSNGLIYVSSSSGVETESVPNRPSAFANAGVNLPANRSRQVELGVKQGWGKTGEATLALYSISRPTSESLALGDGRAELVGGARRVRHRGIEFTLDERLSPSWRLEGNASWLIASTVRALDSSMVGLATPNVPRAAGALSIAWMPRVMSGWAFTQRLTGAGSRAVVPGVKLAGYSQYDVAARVDWPTATAAVHWNFGVDNVFDRRYWREAPTQPWGGVYLFPAAPRRYHLTLSADF